MQGVTIRWTGHAPGQLNHAFQNSCVSTCTQQASCANWLKDAGESSLACPYIALLLDPSAWTKWCAVFDSLWLRIARSLFSKFKWLYIKSMHRDELGNEAMHSSSFFMIACTLLLSLHSVVQTNKGKSNPTRICEAAYTLDPRSWLRGDCPHTKRTRLLMLNLVTILFTSRLQGCHKVVNMVMTNLF